MAENHEPKQIQFQVTLSPDQEMGVFADFASVWHTPTTFILDFLAVKGPQHPAVDAEGQPSRRGSGLGCVFLLSRYSR
jgi:hypothetical protein